jgi:hypothetical protein
MIWQHVRPVLVVRWLLLHLFAAAALVMLAACGGWNTVVLEGTVTDTYSGEPVEAAEVRIDDTSLSPDTEGVYHTSDWNAESRLHISAPGYETLSLTLDETWAESESGPVQAELAETGIVTLTLDTELRPTTLEGVVTEAHEDEPLAGATVLAVVDEEAAADAPEPADEGESEAAAAGGPDVAEAAESEAVLETTTDDEGRYSLVGLPESYTLVISATDHAPLQTELERTTTYNAALRPNTFGGVVTDKYSNEPLEGASVTVGDISTRTDEDGEYLLTDVPEEVEEIEIRASGYASFTQSINPPESIDAALRPDVLESALVDQESGEGVAFATVIATETMTSTAVASVRIDNSKDGSFTLEGLPESGYLQVLAPGYRKAVMEITPGNIPSEIALEPFYARALYIKTTTAAYLPERMENFYNVIDNTELNALVIDLKSDNLADLGLIYYDSQVPIVQELGTSADLMDIEGILAEAKRRNIYTIARIHIFAHDNLLAETKPEWAAQNAIGCVPNENRKCNGDVFYADWDIAWLDPWNRNVWEYNIQLGIEAAQMGFDEVQFDYIRFPNDAAEIEHMRLSKPIDWRNNPQPMYENIATFMEQAHEQINGVGAFFSVDIFGYAVWSPQANIGQNANLMAPHADYIYPMVYPSHFWTNEMGFDNAAAHPYEIVAESLRRGHEMVGDKRAKMRPWLQDFTLIWVPDHLIVRYGVPEVQAQIQAVDDAPYAAGWAMWDPDNEYTLDAFRPAE